MNSSPYSIGCFIIPIRSFLISLIFNPSNRENILCADFSIVIFFDVIYAIL
nr:MAG TPA: hypothetical protein [Caudoviricetes sp.]